MSKLNSKKIVAVQGLGFVGAAMATAVASAKDAQGQPIYEVVGVDLENPLGTQRVEKLNQGKFPLETSDASLKRAVLACVGEQGNLKATTDNEVYQRADVIVVDVPLDIHLDTKEVNFAPFRSAITTFAEVMKKDALILVETTVPPGTCEKVVAPIIEQVLLNRGLPTDQFKLCHSYERVMPGQDYLDSIINYWRVYSGRDEKSRKAGREFLSSVINTEKYPLRELKSTNASETAKVLENSYRAMTIAFMEEWGRFAEAIDMDLFEVIDAIRDRPTHNNIRQPGFGVGGYCLTKDPLFVGWASQEFFNLENKFPFCEAAVAANQNMPLESMNHLKRIFNKDLSQKKILLMGISYKQDVGDTRYSPSQIFFEAARAEGANVDCHDPLMDHWEDMDISVDRKLPVFADYDAVVLAVQHKEYQDLDFSEVNSSLVLFDGNRVLTEKQIEKAKENSNIQFFGIGRGKQ